MIRVFLVDDHEIVRRGLRDLVESAEDMEVVGEAATASEALVRVPVAAPTVAVLDVRLEDGTGIEVCRELRAADPDLRCLMLTSFSDDEALLAAIVAGASGYLLKQIRSIELLESIRIVAAGGTLFDPSDADRVVARLRGGAERDERLRHLTPQETRLLALLAEGKTNRQIADEMFLAEKTVKNYVSSVLAKMGMSRRTEAAVYAVRAAERRGRQGA